LTKTLDAKDLDRLADAFAKAPELAQDVMGGRMETNLMLIEEPLQNYPPQPPRDRAKTFNTYVRGRGRYPRSAFPGGQFNAKAARGLIRAGKVKLTSERLGTKWTHQVEFSDEAITGVLGNTASYADEVQGDQQAAFHAETGWKTLDDVLLQQEQAIYDNFEAGIDELWEKLGG